MPTDPPDADLAADVVWLDALITNVDRTPRNPNLLRWHGNLWLIDHGAALYAFHGADPLARARSGFPAIRDHVLLPGAGSIAAADERLASRADPPVSALVPSDWADGDAYAEFLTRRLESAANVGGGGRTCPRVARSSTRRCGSSRASSAARRSTPASSSSAARCASSAPARSSTRQLLAALAPDCDPAASREQLPRDRADRGRGRGRRADRRAARLGALPLARRAREHDRAARPGPHRSDG